MLIGKGILTAIVKGITDNLTADNLSRVIRSMISGLSKAVCDSSKSIHK